MALNLSQHLTHPVFKVASEIVTEKGLQAYVIGGYVRDLILERPSKDIDIVTEGSGLELAELCAKALGVKKVSYFKKMSISKSPLKNVDKKRWQIVIGQKSQSRKI